MHSTHIELASFSMHTSKSKRAFANVSIDIINASCIILARIGHALIDVDLTCFAFGEKSKAVIL